MTGAGGAQYSVGVVDQRIVAHHRLEILARHIERQQRAVAVDMRRDRRVHRKAGAQPPRQFLHAGVIAAVVAHHHVGERHLHALRDQELNRADGAL